MTTTTCNDRIMKETVMSTGEPKKMVENIIGHYSALIAERIKEGSFESVRVPYFGLFRAKLKQLQWRAFYQALPKTKVRSKK